MLLKDLITNLLKLTTIVLFVIALFLPAYSGHEGYVVLILGALAWFGLPQIIGFFAWTANIFLFYSFLSKHRVQVKLVLSAIAVILGALGYFVDEIYVTEGGNKEHIEVKFGYYFWMGSMVSNFALQLFQNKKDELLDFLINFKREYL